jgi:hypothetical protein
MIQAPFKPENFASEMKPKISGMNLSLEYYNLESSIMKVARQITAIIPAALYNRLATLYLNGIPTAVEEPAIDYLQRAMLHFTVYEHKIYLMLTVSNDGILTKKTDTETTAFKYQTDELADNLLSTAWFWMNELIKYLEENLNDFPEWRDSDERKAYLELPVDLNDFNRWVGVELASEYFMLSVGWIIREVWIDCVKSRLKTPVKTDAITRAVCYEVMGRACERLAYNCLPSPIRRDIDNEYSIGKNHRAQVDRYIRELIAGKYLQKALNYWNAVDLEIKRERIAASLATVGSRPVIGRKDITADNKFYYS